MSAKKHDAVNPPSSREHRRRRAWQGAFGLAPVSVAGLEGYGRRRRPNAAQTPPPLPHPPLSPTCRTGQNQAAL